MQVHDLRAPIEVATAKLDETDQRFKAYMNQDLPAAVARDMAATLADLERARSGLEATIEAFDAADSSRAGAERGIEQRPVTRRQERQPDPVQ